jgi:hypothetical protein
MRLEFSDDPVKALKQLRLFHFAVAASVLLMAYAAEIIVSRNDGPIVDLEGFAWALRLLFSGYALWSVVLMVWINEKRIVARGMKAEPRKPDFVVKGALEATQVIRSSSSFLPTTLGMILFILSGERLDLYVPVAVSILLLALIRPTRKHWEETYATASREYPGVSSTPWAAA